MPSSQISGHESLTELQWKRQSYARLVLTREALLRVIGRFLSDSLTASELQEFGDLLEGEPVDYDDESEDRVIAQVLFEMSSPEINGAIDHGAAARWIEMLRVT
jgi:hypothetical protein